MDEDQKLLVHSSKASQNSLLSALPHMTLTGGLHGGYTAVPNWPSRTPAGDLDPSACAHPSQAVGKILQNPSVFPSYHPW